MFFMYVPHHAGQHHQAPVLLWGQLADVVITSITTTVITIIKWFKVTEAASLLNSNFIDQNQRLPAVPTCVSWPDTGPHNDLNVWVFFAGVFLSSSRSFCSSVVVSFTGNKKTSCHLQHGTAGPHCHLLLVRMLYCRGVSLIFPHYLDHHWVLPW